MGETVTSWKYLGGLLLALLEPGFCPMALNQDSLTSLIFSGTDFCCFGQNYLACSELQFIYYEKNVLKLKECL